MFRHRPGQNLGPNSLYGMSSSSVDSCRHLFSLPVIPTPVKKTGLAALHLCVLPSELHASRQNNLHAWAVISYQDTDWSVQIIELVPAHAFGTLEISPQASYYLPGSPNSIIILFQSRGAWARGYNFLAVAGSCILYY